MTKIQMIQEAEGKWSKANRELMKGASGSKRASLITKRDYWRAVADRLAQ